MNCQNARQQITDTLAAGQAKLNGEIAAHVRACAGCRTFYAQQAEVFRAMDFGLSAMANEPAPASLVPRVRGRMEETRASNPWFYRFLPAAAVLVIACLIALPLVRRSFRPGGVQVTVIPKRSENGVEPRQPLAGQPEKSRVPPATREPSPRHSARPAAPQMPAQTVELAILVSPEESQGLLQLAAAVPRSPQWAQAMVHPATPPASQIAPIEPVEIANLEVNSLSEGNQ